MVQPPIAIIGIGCRFPGIQNHREFWDFLRAGRAATHQQVAHKELFDADFFGLAPQVVELMDPQQRLLLEVSWETFEDAGIIPTSLAKSQTGIFVGVNDSEYAQQLDQHAQQQFEFTVGNRAYIAANRLSNFYDLCGVSLAIHTACSSGLMAVDRACRSLWTGESDLTLVGGVNLVLDVLGTTRLQQAGLIAQDGYCKVFDKAADGYVRSEGVGCILLKPLAQAEKDNDQIYAVIRGSSTNHNGRSNGLTAPNLQAQVQLLERAYREANIKPQAVSYVETHATGTTIGDALELKAIGKVLGKGRSPEHPCWVGSVKTNIGHTETASGMAGLIKTALMLHHGKIPQHLHFTEPNDAVKFDKLNIAVPRALRELSPAVADDKDINDITYASVSAFGLGGSNVHTILSTKPIANASRQTPTPIFAAHLFVLSAKSQSALKQLVQRYQQLCQTQPDLDLGALCCAVSTTRAPFAHRLGIVVCSLSELQQELTHYLQGIASDRLLSGQVSKRQRKKKLLSAVQGKIDISSLEQLAEEQVINQEVLTELLLDICLLWLEGNNFDWQSLYPRQHFPPLQLPTYPFQRQRYWIAKAIQTVLPPNPSPTAIAKAITAVAHDTKEFIPPRTDLEKQLVESWQEVLDIKEIGIQDNFFNLGGDSLRSRQLALRIEKKLKLNYRLPISALYELSTVAEQAKLIAEPSKKEEIKLLASPTGDRLTLDEYKHCVAIAVGRPGRRIHPTSLINLINEKGTQQPLFCCANSYKEIHALQSALGPERPFYLLESGLIAFQASRHRPISALATHYVQDILKIQPEPPYAICGYSFGAYVAYEVAQQLTALGKEVKALIVLDRGGNTPQYVWKRDLWHSYLTLTNDGFSKFQDRAINYLKRQWSKPKSSKPKSSKPNLTTAVGEGDKQPLSNQTVVVPDATSKPDVQQNKHYRFQPYHQPFHMIVAEDEFLKPSSGQRKPPLWLAPRMGWPASIVSNYHCDIVPGNHFSMLKSPYVHMLAQKLGEIIG